MQKPLAVALMMVMIGCASPPASSPQHPASATPASSSGERAVGASATRLAPPFVAAYIQEHGLCAHGTAPADVTRAVLPEDPADAGGIRVTSGPSQVRGRLPPEVIQHIVRQNYTEFRLCYENGLRIDRNLRGEVRVRFVIGRDGTVTNVTNDGSDIPDANVVACVMRGYEHLCFPKPEDGIVTVFYPINFSP
jgi:outer membrane biosynthesis protein TonB